MVTASRSLGHTLHLKPACQRLGPSSTVDNWLRVQVVDASGATWQAHHDKIVLPFGKRCTPSDMPRSFMAPPALSLFTVMRRDEQVILASLQRRLKRDIEYIAQKRSR